MSAPSLHQPASPPLRIAIIIYTMYGHIGKRTFIENTVYDMVLTDRNEHSVAESVKDGIVSKEAEIAAEIAPKGGSKVEVEIFQYGYPTLQCCGCNLGTRILTA